MSIPFGPQLLGETEKTLNALLRRALEGTGLTESLWVTLRLADLLDGTVDAPGLAAAAADRAQFSDAADLVGELNDRGLLNEGRLTDAGREMLTAVLGTSGRLTGPIWDDLPTADVAATTRVLNEVLTRARVALH
jgi:hypothetical protein